MINITAFLKVNSEKKNSEFPIMLRLFLNGTRVELKTGLSIEEKYWNYDKRVIRRSKTNYKDLNLKLSNRIDRVTEISIRYRYMNKRLTSECLKYHYYGEPHYGRFIVWMKSEIQSRKGYISDPTMNHHLSIHRCIKEFKPELRFNELNKDLIEDFQKFLKVTKNNRLTTIEKKLKVFKSYVNRAIERHLILDNPFRRIVIRKGKFRFDYLEGWEVKKLIKYYKSSNIRANHLKVLRLFLFSCFTGLRLADSKRIAFEHIIGNTVVLTPQKTKNVNSIVVKIPLAEFAKQLINDSRKNGISGKIFDTYSDQKTNEYLKIIALNAGIQKAIKFRMARHTFATIFYQINKDLASLQSLLGHANIQQTMIYTHVNDKTMREGMKKLNKVFSINH